MGKTLSLFDFTSNKIVNSISNSHFNGILSCEFKPINQNVICTSGMDYA